MEILNNIAEDEIVEVNAEIKTSKQLKNSILANLLYLFMWVAFDVFSVYILTMPKVTKDFWFIVIPVAGLNVIILWVYIFKILKDATLNKNTGYVLTDKAIYYYSDNKYKILNRIALKDIVAVEKSEFIADGFYVASLTNTIHIKNVKEEKELFNAMVEKVSKQS